MEKSLNLAGRLEYFIGGLKELRIVGTYFGCTIPPEISEWFVLPNRLAVRESYLKLHLEVQDLSERGMAVISFMVWC